MRGPRIAEALLRGFIADPDLEDAILGDLVEEWRDRAERTGSPPARTWYWEQAVRSVPHLFRAWWRQQSPVGAARTLGRVSLALLLALSLAAATAVGLLIVAGGGPGGGGPDVARAILLAAGGWAAVAGFVLARRTSDAPMASAVLLGLSWLPATPLAALAHPVPGPPGSFLLLFPTLAFALTVVGGAIATTLRGPRPPAHFATHETDPPTSEEAMTEKATIRLGVRPLFAAAIVLAVPLVAMQFRDEVVWTLSDFVVMGTLVFGTGLLFELALAKTESTVFRAAAGVALAAGFLLFWVNGAVGVIGAAANDANAMYLGVLAVAVGGAIGAGFEPRGMARAMVATALAQLAVGAVALIGGLGGAENWQIRLIALSGFFAMLFLGSAWLFRRAAGSRSNALAEAAG